MTFFLSLSRFIETRLTSEKSACFAAHVIRNDSRFTKPSSLLNSIIFASCNMWVLAFNRPLTQFHSDLWSKKKHKSWYPILSSLLLTNRCEKTNNSDSSLTPKRKLLSLWTNIKCLLLSNRCCNFIIAISVLISFSSLMSMISSITLNNSAQFNPE